MDGSLSQSASTVRSLPQHILADLEATDDQENTSSGSNPNHSSLPSSPRSSALPSPPDSPTDSVSSLPSVSSSFFFSSAAASPGHLSQPFDSDHDSHSEGSASRNATRGLIIPSLTLPPALRRPTPYGQTLGELRLLVLGRQGAGKSFLTGLLFEDNEEVVEVGTWEDPVGEDGEGDEEMILLGMAGAKVLRASTAWVEQHDPHGLEKIEPSRNVEIVELPGYDAMTKGDSLVSGLQSIVHAPFHTIADVLHPKSQPSALLANLLSSAATPLFTALILLLPSAPTPLDRLIVDSLAGDIPVIVLSTPPSFSSNASSQSFSSSFASKISAFRPASPGALKSGLFHSPETISVLRTEATERFMHWREIERAVAAVVQPDHPSRSQRPSKSVWDRWDKEKWEREWMMDFSWEVNTRVQTSKRRETITSLEHPPPPYHDEKEDDTSYLSPSFERPPPSPSCHHSVLPHAQAFDPLHLPSLLLFAVSMLGPLKSRILESIRTPGVEYLNDDAASLPSSPAPLFHTSDEADNRLLSSPRTRERTVKRPSTTAVRWLVFGGLISAGFCAGVSVGVAWTGSSQS